MNELMHIQKELGQSPQPRTTHRADPDEDQRSQKMATICWIGWHHLLIIAAFMSVIPPITG